jgi:type I restriction enzyme S subunit
MNKKKMGITLMGNKGSTIKAKAKQGVQPKLRFPEFQDAESWGEEKLEELYSFKSTNSLSRDKLTVDKGKVRNVHYGDIHTKFSTHFDIEKEDVPYIVESESLEKIKSESFCKESDVIFVDASEDMDDIGKCIEIVNLKNEKLLSGLHTILARQKKGYLIVGFAGHLFQSRRLRAKIQNEAQGTKVLGISGGRLASIDVCFPKDKKEQQKITDCLSSLDELIETENQKLEGLQRHKKWLMQQLFPAEGQTFPKRRFSKFKGEWVEEKISYLDLKVTAGATPDTTNAKYWGGNIRWMNSGELNLKKVYEVKNRISEEGLEKSSTKLLPKFCVLIGLAGQGKTRGTVAMNMIELCTNQSIAAIHPSKKMNNNFLYHELDRRYEELRVLSAGDGGRGGLNLQILKDLKIIYPELDEQQKIADSLSSIDDLIITQSQKLDALRDHKKGLMQQLFPAMSEVQG